MSKQIANATAVEIRNTKQQVVQQFVTITTALVSLGFSFTVMYDASLKQIRIFSKRNPREIKKCFPEFTLDVDNRLSEFVTLTLSYE